MTPPLILTLTIDKNATEYFNELRSKYFPVERNFLMAHLTLFHALPNTENIVADVKTTCSVQTNFAIEVVKPTSIGKGVAFKIVSDELTSIHRQLQSKWSKFLSPQDKQKLWPHVTIQNKVAPEEAQQLLETLQATFSPFKADALGLQLYEYLNGPWRLKEEFHFNNY